MYLLDILRDRADNRSIQIVPLANSDMSPVPKNVMMRSDNSNMPSVNLRDSLFSSNIYVAIDAIMHSKVRRIVYTGICCIFRIAMYNEIVITVAKNDLNSFCGVDCLNISIYI